MLIYSSSWKPEHSYSLQCVAAFRKHFLKSEKMLSQTFAQISFSFFLFPLPILNSHSDCEMLSDYSNSDFVHNNIVENKKCSSF